MAEYLEDTQVIASTLGMPKEIVDGVLKGEITDDDILGYDLTNPSEIKIIEQKKFIRSRAIGVIGPNNIESSKLVAYLATNLAKRVKYDIAIADFNEFPLQATYLGLNHKDRATYINFTYGTEDDFKDKGVYHPDIANLSLFLNATNSKQQLAFTNENLISLLNDISKNYTVVFVDCPNSLERWEAIIPYLDFIVVGVEQDLLNINKYNYIYNYLCSLNVSDRSSIVLLSDGQNNNLSSVEVRKLLSTIGELPILGVLPYDISTKKIENIFKTSKYSLAINTVLDDLFPDTLGKREKGGFLKSLLSNF